MQNQNPIQNPAEKYALLVLQRLIDSNKKVLAADLLRTVHLWRNEMIDDDVLMQKAAVVQKKWAKQLDQPG